MPAMKCVSAYLLRHQTSLPSAICCRCLVTNGIPSMINEIPAPTSLEIPLLYAKPTIAMLSSRTKNCMVPAMKCGSAYFNISDNVLRSTDSCAQSNTFSWSRYRTTMIHHHTRTIMMPVLPALLRLVYAKTQMCSCPLTLSLFAST
jgi:hypothetical protein